MSEDRRKRSKREIIDDVLDMGREMGSIAKSDPDLWDWLVRESHETGKKKHEIIKDSLRRMLIERKVIAAGLTMEQLLAAWEIKDEMEKWLIDKVMRFGTTFIQGFLMQIGELINAINYERQRQFEEAYEERKKHDAEMQLKMVQAQMARTILQAMMPAIMQIMTQLNPQLAKTMPQIIQATQQTSEQGEQDTGMELEVI